MQCTAVHYVVQCSMQCSLQYTAVQYGMQYNMQSLTSKSADLATKGVLPTGRFLNNTCQ